MEEDEERALKSHELKAKHQQSRRDQWFNSGKAEWDAVRIKQEGLLCKLHVLQERTRELFINNSNLIAESDVPLFVEEEYYAPNTAVNKTLQQNLYWIDPSILENDKRQTNLTEGEVLSTVMHHLKKNYPNGELLILQYWGSRAHGIQDQLSDWDLVAIMRNIEPPDLEVNTIEIGKSIDVSVHEVNSFQHLLDDHNIWAIYLFYYPTSTYLYNKDNLTMKDLFHINFRFPKLKAEMYNSCVTLSNQAFSYYRALAIRRAKKRLVYVVRHIDYLCQILSDNCISDIGRMNSFARDVMLMYFDTCADFESFTNAECVSRLKIFKKFVNKYKKTELEVTTQYGFTEMKQNMFHFYVTHYIQSKGIESLYKDLGIKVHYHNKFPQLSHLKTFKDVKYFASHVMMASNGLVLDLEQMNIVSYPYNHFPQYDNRYLFGHKSKNKPPFVNLNFEIDWETAIVSDKMDGYLMTLFYYNGEWLTSSKHTADGSEIQSQKNLSLSHIFWEIWEHNNYQYPSPSLNRCYMFELCSNKVRKIVFHERERLVLHGCRDLTTMSELDATTIANENKWECVEIIKPPQSGNKKNLLHSWTIFVNRLSPYKSKGYIVRDANWNRVSIPSLVYKKFVEYKEIKDVSKKRAALIHLVLSSWTSFEEFVSRFPYEKEVSLLVEVLEKFELFCKEMDCWYEENKNTMDLKKNDKIHVGPYCFKAEIFHSFRAGKCLNFKEAFVSFYPKSEFLQIHIEKWALQL